MGDADRHVSVPPGGPAVPSEFTGARRNIPTSTAITDSLNLALMGKTPAHRHIPETVSNNKKLLFSSF